MRSEMAAHHTCFPSHAPWQVEPQRSRLLCKTGTTLHFGASPPPSSPSPHHSHRYIVCGHCLALKTLYPNMNQVRLTLLCNAAPSNRALQPPLNIDRHPTGHTHPLKTPPPSMNTDRKRLQDLVDDQVIHLDLRGLLWEDSVTVAEILAPHTRRSPFVEDGKSTALCVLLSLTCMQRSPVTSTPFRVGKVSHTLKLASSWCGTTSSATA
jgi:hypothetical protein